MTRDDETAPRSHLRVSWTWLSIGLTLVAGSAIGTLVVVSSVNDVDSLSTIALALAVLAFAAQLIISLAQGIAGSQQLANVERVNADTKSALAAVRAAVDSLLSNQSEHFSDLLRAFLNRDSPESISSPEATVAENDSSEMLERLLRGASPKAAGPEHKVLTEYPDEEKGTVLATMFRNLSPWAAQQLGKLARNAVIRSRRGDPHGGWMNMQKEGDPGPGTAELKQLEVVRIDKRLKPDGSEGDWVELTPTGLELASLMTGVGPPPKWLLETMRA